MKINPKLFPTIIIILAVCAACVYAYHGNWRKAIYWAAAATLTGAVTW